jgi:hypothetical protein
VAGEFFTSLVMSNHRSVGWGCFPQKRLLLNGRFQESDLSCESCITSLARRTIGNPAINVVNSCYPRRSDSTGLLCIFTGYFCCHLVAEWMRPDKVL